MKENEIKNIKKKERKKRKWKITIERMNEQSYLLPKLDSVWDINRHLYSLADCYCNPRVTVDTALLIASLKPLWWMPIHCSGRNSSREKLGLDQVLITFEDFYNKNWLLGFLIWPDKDPNTRFIIRTRSSTESNKYCFDRFFEWVL